MSSIKSLYTIKSKPKQQYMREHYTVYQAKLNQLLQEAKQEGKYDAILHDYINGTSKADLVAKYNLSWLKIRLILKDTARPERISDEQLQLTVQQLRAKSKQKKEIMQKYSVSYNYLSKRIAKLVNLIDPQ